MQEELEEMERIIITRVNTAVPRDVDSLERMFIEHREFEMQIRTVETSVQNLQRTYATIPQKSASLQSKLDKVMEKWEKVWNLSSLYVDRLKTVEVVLTSMEETKSYVSQFEMKLASYDHLPADDDGLRKVLNLKILSLPYLIPVQ